MLCKQWFYYTPVKQTILDFLGTVGYIGSILSLYIYRENDAVYSCYSSFRKACDNITSECHTVGNIMAIITNLTSIYVRMYFSSVCTIVGLKWLQSHCTFGRVEWTDSKQVKDTLQISKTILSQISWIMSYARLCSHYFSYYLQLISHHENWRHNIYFFFFCLDSTKHRLMYECINVGL